MDWILDNLQIAILVIWALAIWIKKVIDYRVAQRRAREAPPEPEELPDGFEMEEEDEEISLDDWVERPVPPPPPSLPPPSPFPPPLPPVVSRGGGTGLPSVESPPAGPWAVVAKEADDPVSVPVRARETRATTTGGAAATRLRISAERDPLAKKPAAAPQHRRAATLQRQLKQRSEIRRAIILKEILSRPVSLRHL